MMQALPFFLIALGLFQIVAVSRGWSDVSLAAIPTHFDLCGYGIFDIFLNPIVEYLISAVLILIGFLGVIGVINFT